MAVVLVQMETKKIRNSEIASLQLTFYITLGNSIFASEFFPLTSAAPEKLPSYSG